MLVFPQGLILLSVPKTGSTSLEAAFAPHALVAVTSIACGREVSGNTARHKWGPAEVWGVIRDPFDWVRSWYQYRCTMEFAGTSRFALGRTFEQFVDRWAGGERMQGNLLDLQSDFLAGADRVYTFEALGVLAKDLGARLGATVALPRLNVSPQQTAYMSDKTADKIRFKAAKDFEIYERLNHAL